MTAGPDISDLSEHLSSCKWLLGSSPWAAGSWLGDKLWSQSATLGEEGRNVSVMSSEGKWIADPQNQPVSASLGFLGLPLWWGRGAGSPSRSGNGTSWGAGIPRSGSRLGCCLVMGPGSSTFFLSRWPQFLHLYNGQGQFHANILRCYSFFLCSPSPGEGFQGER